MRKSPPTVWIISDDSHRVQQSLALAQALSDNRLIHSASEIDFALQSNSSSPDIIIGTGEQTSAAILQAKEFFKDKPLAVSLLKPQKNMQGFDLIVVPEYEPHEKASNVITSIGLLNKITPALLKGAPLSVDFSAPYIAVLVGGNYIGRSYNEEDMLLFSNELNQLSKLANASLLITTSPRTTTETVSTLTKHVNCEYSLYDYRKEQGAHNPYLSFLNAAEEIVVSEDSIRMICEACSANKPVHIFTTNEGFKPYANLYSQLYELGYAKRFDGQPFGRYVPHSPLNEAERIAAYIKSRML